MNITISFDGGCRPTNPGNKYGSYEVALNGKRLCLASQVEFGLGTNNEAEFEALEAGLIWTLNQLEVCGNKPADFSLNIFSDSMIVVHRLANNKKPKSEPQHRMFNHAKRCLDRIKLFKSVKVHWHRRDNNVALFGH